ERAFYGIISTISAWMGTIYRPKLRFIRIFCQNRFLPIMAIPALSGCCFPEILLIKYAYAE
ncbi:MAG: hypothetical protein ACYTGS_12795, partial [Planctomycetota bacterium]